jgi:hypothetical protein
VQRTEDYRVRSQRHHGSTLFHIRLVYLVLVRYLVETKRNPFQPEHRFPWDSLEII